MKKKVENYIEFCKDLKFSVGESTELMATEDIIHYGKRFINGSISDEIFLSLIEATGCPQVEYNKSKKPCENNTGYQCSKCWEQFFK